MKLRISLVLYCLASIAQASPVSVHDDRNQLITLKQPAQRIVVLSPHLAENLYAIGAGPQIVGAVSFSNYPEAAKALPIVGSYDSFDLERIRALKPDLLVVWQTGNPPAQLARLDALGLPIFYDNAQKLPQVPTVLERLGVLTGHQLQARQVAQQFRDRIARLQQQYQQQKPVRVFYQIWDRPLMTINKAQIISDVMTLCGAVNVFADLPLLVPTIDEEAVVMANPDLIATSGETGPKSDWLLRWQRWPRLKAVQQHNLVILPPDLLSRMGPRLTDGAEKMCQAIDTARRKS